MQTESGALAAPWRIRKCPYSETPRRTKKKHSILGAAIFDLNRDLPSREGEPARDPFARQRNERNLADVLGRYRGPAKELKEALAGKTRQLAAQGETGAKGTVGRAGVGDVHPGAELSRDGAKLVGGDARGRTSPRFRGERERPR